MRILTHFYRILAGLALSSTMAMDLRAQDHPTEFGALTFYSTTVESDHIKFAKVALVFLRELSEKEHFTLDVTTNWNDLNATNLMKYRVVIWINDFPHTSAQRKTFQDYMVGGGGWLGFHIAGYNDKDTQWPWFVEFFGDSVFYSNNWPALPAKLTVDDRAHPVTRNLPGSFISPTNEWYFWKPSPRLNKDIKVLLTLDPSNYPLGKKDILREGDLPVVWTNTRYRMLYMNMGHGPEVMSDATQNKLIANGLLWLGRGNIVK
jgi:type 1 glutamine amidotransferase